MPYVQWYARCDGGKYDKDHFPLPYYDKIVPRICIDQATGKMCQPSKAKDPYFYYFNEIDENQSRPYVSYVRSSDVRQVYEKMKPEKSCRNCRYEKMAGDQTMRDDGPCVGCVLEIHWEPKSKEDPMPRGILMKTYRGYDVYTRAWGEDGLRTREVVAWKDGKPVHSLEGGNSSFESLWGYVKAGIDKDEPQEPETKRDWENCTHPEKDNLMVCDYPCKKCGHYKYKFKPIRLYYGWTFNDEPIGEITLYGNRVETLGAEIRAHGGTEISWEIFKEGGDTPNRIRSARIFTKHPAVPEDKPKKSEYRCTSCGNACACQHGGLCDPCRRVAKEKIKEEIESLKKDLETI